MRNHKLEFSLLSIFFIFLIILLSSTLGGIYRPLPFILLGICTVFLVYILFPSKKTQDSHIEAYAPKYFSQTVISCVLGIAVILFANVILNKNRFSKNFDLTTNKVNSLSKETVQFLGSLKKQIRIICVPSPNPSENYCDNSSDLVSLYEKNSPNIINLKELNLGDKVIMQKVQPSGFSRLVFLTDDNKAELDGQITESRLTNAIVNLVKFKKVVYFLSGSGEPSVQGNDSDRSYADIVSALQSKAYEVKDWNIKQGDLPADARVLVAGDNAIRYGSEVERMLQTFVSKGGKLVLIVNPYREQGLENFYQFLHLKLSNTLLTLDTNTALGKQIAKQNLMRPPVIVTNFSSSSPITKVVSQVYGAQAVMPVDGGRPIEILEDKDPQSKIHSTVLMTAYSAAPITLTAEERNKIDLSKPFLKNPDKNYVPSKQWPLGVDVQLLGDKPNSGSEVVVFGFSIVNPFSRSIPISDELIPLSIAHLYQDQELVSIPPRDIGPKPFNLSRNPGGWLPFFSGILPVLTALIGFFIWMRRRAA
jgi:hypothetical protein